MSKTKEQRWSELHEFFMQDFDQIQSVMRDERLQCVQDRRFATLAGAQWEGPLGIQFENKPRMEVNKIHMAVTRIINEYRNNTITASFVSKDGSDNDALADTCARLYRSDEQESVAEEAYNNGFEEAVLGGFGAWRLRTAYENEEDADDERQRICIEPIFDADSSVFFDLDAKRQDKADAKRCYVLTAMTREAYRDEYDDDPASWPKMVHQRQFDWLTPDVVYVAEAFKVEEVATVSHVFRGLSGEERKVMDDDLQDVEEELKALGFREVRNKKLKIKKVHKYIMSGARILEDCGYISGKCIPIIPVYGKRWYIDNVERCMGHVRLAKDAQRLKNMQLSKLAEYAAVSSLGKPIMTPEQIAGHQQMWADDNIKNYPYLLVNQLTDAMGSPAAIGPQAYLQPAELPPAMAALLQLTESDMGDILGRAQDGEKMLSNIGEKTVSLIQQRLDMQTYIYVSNFARAIKRTGEVWLSMAREVLVEDGRRMKGINAQGDAEQITLRAPGLTPNGVENDLSDADFDVVTVVGPSSVSRKSSTVSTLTEMLPMVQDPETAQVLTSMIMMNLEGEGIGDVRDYFRRKLIHMGAVKPNDEEAQALQEEAAATAQQPPDANTQFMLASTEQASAQAAKARADIMLVAAKTRESEAKTLETFAGITQAERQQAIDALTALGPLAEHDMGESDMPQQSLESGDLT